MNGFSFLFIIHIDTDTDTDIEELGGIGTHYYQRKR